MRAATLRPPPLRLRPRHRAGQTLVAAGAVLVACSAGEQQASNVSLSPTLVFPRDVLQNATAVTLAVYTQTSSLVCTAATGQAAGVTSTTATVSTATLSTCAPPSTSKFCGTLTITESASPLVFAATATDASGNTIAYGCASQVVDAAAVSLNIAMISSTPAFTCGNGVIEPTEQCDPGADGGTDPLCDSACHSVEEVLSTGATTPQGPAFFLWPSSSGQRFLGFFTDASGGGGSNADVALRVLDDALEPVSTPASAANAILAPNDTTSTLPPVSAPGNQSQPSAAYLDGTYFYVFADDANGPPSIHLRSFDTSLVGQQAQAAPIVIDGPADPVAPLDGGTDGGKAADAGPGGDTSASPSIAVNGAGLFFIAWQDATSGQILGRTYAPTGGTLGTTTPVSTSGSTNENVQVAGTPSGWLVVWDDTNEVKLRVYSSNGTADGAEIVVSNATHTGVQDHPAIATLADGRAAVVWADHGTAEGADIFVQRYDANVVAVASDQASPINNVITAGDQITPAIAGTSAAKGSFVAAWVDSASGQIEGRILDGTSGFDFNPIDGTASEFIASVAAMQQRENPVVVVGGAGPWTAIGWDVGGVVSARRFPTSTETHP